MQKEGDARVIEPRAKFLLVDSQDGYLVMYMPPYFVGREFFLWQKTLVSYSYGW